MASMRRTVATVGMLVGAAAMAQAQTIFPCDICGGSFRDFVDETAAAKTAGSKGSLDSMTLQWTCSNTGGNNNNQASGKWGFVGNPPAAPAMISVDAGGSYGPLQCGQQFTVTNIGHPDTTFTFQNGASVTIHTSCSQPLQAGDQFGSLLVIGSNNCNGPAPPPPCVQRPEDCNSNCDVCVSKSYAPTLMTFTLTGGPPTLSNDQDGKAKASGGNIQGAATVTCYGKNGYSPIGGTGLVQLGGSFNSATDGSEMTCRIVSGSVSQDVTIHVSCSKPLHVGDRFGALTVTDMVLGNSRRPSDFCPPCVVCCNMGEVQVPPPVTVECDGMGNTGELQHFVDSATCSCATGPLTVSWTATPFQGPSACQQTTTVTWTCGDDCGNTHTKSSTFTIRDTTGPVIVRPAMDKTVECSSGDYASIPELAAWLADHGGMRVDDRCLSETPCPSPPYMPPYVPPPPPGYQAPPTYAPPPPVNPYTYNPYQTYQYYNRQAEAAQDRNSYSAPPPPPPPTGYYTQYNSNVYGSPVAPPVQYYAPVAPPTYYVAPPTQPPAPPAPPLPVWSSCGHPIIWDPVYTPVFTDCSVYGYNGEQLKCAEVTFTARDTCGNAVSTKARFVIADTQPPRWTCPGESLTFNCDASCAGYDQWETDARGFLRQWLDNKACLCAEDCSAVTITNNFNWPPYGNLCGTSGQVTFTATDARGHSSTKVMSYNFPAVSPPPPQQCNACGTTDIYGQKVKADLLSLSFRYSGPATTVVVTDKNGNGAGANTFQVNQNSEFMVTAGSFCSNAKSSGGSSSSCTKFSTETNFRTGTTATNAYSSGSEVSLHTSCSQPIYIGQVVTLANGGTITIIDFTTSTGSAASCPGYNNPSYGNNNCQFPRICGANPPPFYTNPPTTSSPTYAPPPPPCNVDICPNAKKSGGGGSSERPTSITFQYIGGASITDTQSGKAQYDGPASVGNARVCCVPGDTAPSSCGGTSYPINAVVPAFATNQDSGMACTVVSQSGVMKINIHVSCSKPLFTDYIFGSLKIVAFEQNGQQILSHCAPPIPPPVYYNPPSGNAYGGAQPTQPPNAYGAQPTQPPNAYGAQPTQPYTPPSASYTAPPNAYGAQPSQPYNPPPPPPTVYGAQPSQPYNPPPPPPTVYGTRPTAPYTSPPVYTPPSAAYTPPPVYATPAPPQSPCPTDGCAYATRFEVITFKYVGTNGGRGQQTDTRNNGKFITQITDMNPTKQSPVDIFIKSEAYTPSITNKGPRFTVPLNAEFSLVGSPVIGGNLIIVVGGAKIKIQANCKQPLGWGDKFGPLVVSGFKARGGDFCYHPIPDTSYTTSNRNASASVAYLIADDNTADDDDGDDDYGFPVDTPLSSSSGSSSSSAASLNAGTIVALTIVCTLIAVFGVILVIKLMRRKSADEHQHLIMQ